ncbi:MAG: RNA-binding domain-containing protein [Thermoplasmatota archaeon]
MHARFHHADFRATAQSTEDPEKVRAAFRFVAGEGAPVEEQTFDGHYGNPILLLTAREKRNGPIRAFFERMSEADLARVAAEAEARMDSEGAFFVRVGKQEAYLGTLALARDEDAIQARIKMAAYPAKREIALSILREFLAEVASQRAPRVG